jgi:hypothetical protein
VNLYQKKLTDGDFAIAFQHLQLRRSGFEEVPELASATSLTSVELALTLVLSSEIVYVQSTASPLVKHNQARLKRAARIVEAFVDYANTLQLYLSQTHAGSQLPQSIFPALKEPWNLNTPVERAIWYAGVIFAENFQRRQACDQLVTMPSFQTPVDALPYLGSLCNVTHLCQDELQVMTSFFEEDEKIFAEYITRSLEPISQQTVSYGLPEYAVFYDQIRAKIEKNQTLNSVLCTTRSDIELLAILKMICAFQYFEESRVQTQIIWFFADMHRLLIQDELLIQQKRTADQMPIRLMLHYASQFVDFAIHELRCRIHELQRVEPVDLEQYLLGSLTTAFRPVDNFPSRIQHIFANLEVEVYTLSDEAAANAV